MAGMEFIAGSTSAIDLVGVSRSPVDLIASLSRQNCDVALIDYSIRGNGHMEGLALLGYLRRTFPKVGLVVLTTHENPAIIRSILALDVSGVVSKFDDIGHIVTAIHASYGGGNYLSPTIKSGLDEASEGESWREWKLTPREIEVIRLYPSGLSINEIAGQLNSSWLPGHSSPVRRRRATGRRRRSGIRNRPSTSARCFCPPRPCHRADASRGHDEVGVRAAGRGDA